jgi:hypothetical protein
MSGHNEPRFTIGDRVRVKQGVTDFDYADMPLGGWAGVVVEIEEGACTTCLVRWSPETLTMIGQLYVDRCQDDGIDFHEKWLDADELLHEPGGAVWMEQPDRVSGQSAPEDPAERVRGVFGLEGSDPLPRVDPGALGAYYEHLFANLSLPFPATWWQDSRRLTRGPRSVVVLHLLDKSLLSESDGILCEAQDEEGRRRLPLHKLLLDPHDANYQCIDDYRYWFAHCGQ